MAENKVLFGLKNVHYAIESVNSTTGVVSWGTPVAIKGAVNLSLSAEGETNDFYADNIKYYTTIANQGYSGDLEIARIPDTMLKDVWGLTQGTTSKVLSENSEVETKYFALLFQVDGDADNECHVLYHCTATRPEIDGATSTATKEPNTQTVSITAAPLSDGRIRARTTAETPTATRTAWFTAVFEESA